MRNFAVEMASAPREKVKCSRNKRKFRQDPPVQNLQGSNNEETTLTVSATITDARSTVAGNWDCRSAEATDNKLKSSASEAVAAEITSGKAFHPEPLKLMRLFATRKGSQGAAGDEDKSHHHIENSAADSDEEEEEEDEEDDEDEEEEYDELDDWTEGELEELLLKSLDSLYKEALGKIQSRGYKPDEALRAVLRQGRCYGGKDAVSSIVDNALVYLGSTANNKKCPEPDEVNSNSSSFSDLKELERSGLKEMVHLLRDFKPALSRGEAMWYLLMYDMNVGLACVTDDDAASSPLQKNLKEPVKLSASLTESTKSSAALNVEVSQCGLVKTSKVKLPKGGSITQISVESISTTKGGGSSTLTTSSSSVPCLALPSSAKGSPPVISLKVHSISTSKPSHANSEVSQSSNQRLGIAANGGKERKQPAEIEKKQQQQQQQQGSSGVGDSAGTGSDRLNSTSRSDESYTAAEGGGKGHFQPNDPSLKVDTVDKKVTREPAGVRKAEESELPAEDEGHCHQKPPDAPAKVPRPDSGKSSDNGSSKDAASTSGKLGSTKEAQKTSDAAGSASSGNVESTIQGQSGKEGAPTRASEKASIDDNTLLNLQQRVKELELQVARSTEWAKERVMQAARKLIKDQQELKALRQERDEANKLKKDKQVSDDSASKKQTDLETALRKASGQADRANATVRRLEAENAELRAEMEAAKLSAAESAASCEEIAKRERKYNKRAQSWEKQKAKLQEELSDERKKYASLQQQLLVVKERLQQAEVRWRQEEKAREEATIRADNERRAREQAEGAAKRREESMRRKAESNYQRHRDDIQRLECEIAQLRTTAEAAQLATSRWGPGVAFTPHMLELSNMQILKDTNLRLRRELLELQEMTEGLARRDVRRDRECVMCMSEEILAELSQTRKGLAEKLVDSGVGVAVNSKSRVLQYATGSGGKDNYDFTEEFVSRERALNARQVTILKD
ncbi:hypothetical protein R1flu_010644 [Riccia fluitans]|uniref:PIR2-like helical domain-containing protein n=1 Tax=Riccia fluitans TaxID=41844 RepID=A0ABD1Z8M4_9MARC